jgi:hypothetical protein
MSGNCICFQSEKGRAEEGKASGLRILGCIVLEGKCLLYFHGRTPALFSVDKHILNVLLYVR